MTLLNSGSVILALSIVALGGCDVTIHQATGPVEHSRRTIELDKTEGVRVRLKMGAGEMKVRGGSADLMNADFSYNIPEWKPEVKYDNGGIRGRIDIEQPSGNHGTVGNSKYIWDLKFNDAKPISMDVEFGAGEGTLELGSLTLENLEVKMGVGQLNLDLRGTPKKEYHVTIRGGVGEATVHLPAGVGIVAEAQGGIGSVSAKGMHKRGDRYVNDVYENNGQTMVRLDIKGGIGQINLVAE